MKTTPLKTLNQASSASAYGTSLTQQTFKPKGLLEQTSSPPFFVRNTALFRNWETPKPGFPDPSPTPPDTADAGNPPYSGTAPAKVLSLPHPPAPSQRGGGDLPRQRQGYIPLTQQDSGITDRKALTWGGTPRPPS